MSKEEHFKLNALGNWEPVEIQENGGDVITGASMGEEAGSRVLDVLLIL